jgi:Amidohydrolase family
LGQSEGPSERDTGLEELRRLKVGEPAPKVVIRQVSYRFEGGERNVLAHDGRGLKKVLQFGAETVDASSQDGLNRRGHLSARHRLAESICPAVPNQALRLHQGSHALLEKEGIALGACDQELPERSQVGGGSDKAAQQPAFERARLQSDASSPPTAGQLNSIMRDVGIYKEVFERGGLIATGTDGPGGAAPGISMQTAMRALVLGGFSEADALKTATSMAAKLLGVADDLGSVEAGKIADLLFINGNPLSDINDLVNIDKVMVHGKVYTQADLMAPFPPDTAD